MDDINRARDGSSTVPWDRTRLSQAELNSKNQRTFELARALKSVEMLN